MKRITLSALLMTLFLLLSCGSGQQAANSGNPGTAGVEQQGVGSLSAVLMEVGRSAENAFYSFLELLSDTLGFTAKSTTKKSDVGDYFNSLGEKLGKASDELEEVAKNSKVEGEGAKDGAIAVAIRSAVDSAKTTLSTLKTHLDSLGQVGDANKVGDANTVQGVGTTPDEPKLKAAYDAFKGIVEESVNAGVVKLETGNTTLKANEGADNKDGAKILSTNTNPDAGDVAKAAAILATVSGKEILASLAAANNLPASPLPAAVLAVEPSSAFLSFPASAFPLSLRTTSTIAFIPFTSLSTSVPATPAAF
ncbi:Variable major outer membrane lipoprotein (plasmid) [Borrelia nietonii YOR]|uniref:Variable large protein n=1 Tax=Borrelia nietonii YOR TaxID=1293576 RepID=W5SB22_9SPIR|nr:Variable major outer membrane lipoprotein [Borrelia nietonii YOR]